MSTVAEYQARDKAIRAASRALDTADRDVSCYARLFIEALDDGTDNSVWSTAAHLSALRDAISRRNKADAAFLAILALPGTTDEVSA